MLELVVGSSLFLAGYFAQSRYWAWRWGGGVRSIPPQSDVTDFLDSLCEASFSEEWMGAGAGGSGGRWRCGGTGNWNRYIKLKEIVF